MPAIYSRFFANSRRSGSVSVTSAAVGKFAWSRRISRVPDRPAEARLLLSADERIVVDGLNELYLFDRNGNQIAALPRWYGCQVALDDGHLSFATAARKDHMRVVDLQGQIIKDELLIPGLIDQSTLALFEPGDTEFIAQIQFAGDIHGAPPFFMIYKSKPGDLWFDWSADVHEPTSPIIPLVNYEQRRLVTSTRQEILIYPLDSRQAEPQPAARFGFPLESATHWCSSDPQGRLYWCGRGETGVAIGMTDLTGALLAVVPDTTCEKISGKPVAPPLLGEDRYWVLANSALLCFQEGRLLWSFEAKETSPTMATALADRSVLIVAVNRLIRVSPEGETMFDVVFEEELNTPPVVDAAGRIYVASKEMLYAFD